MVIGQFTETRYIKIQLLPNIWAVKEFRKHISLNYIFPTLLVGSDIQWAQKQPKDIEFSPDVSMITISTYMCIIAIYPSNTCWVDIICDSLF